ncbi:MAG: hypothetical protein ACK4IS_13380 [Erythrobacter sp.]
MMKRVAIIAHGYGGIAVALAAQLAQGRLAAAAYAAEPSGPDGPRPAFEDKNE